MYQLKINSADEVYPIFFQKGFYADSNFTTVFHSHIYPEIHIILSGEVEFVIGNDQYQFRSNEAFLIPAKVNHYCFRSDPSASSLAFQIDRSAEEVRRLALDPRLCSLIAREQETLTELCDHSRISLYLSAVCSSFWENRKPTGAEKVKNHAFIIHEFFSKNYNRNIRLEDLAKEFHFSTKHTERLVEKSTGLTFRQNLMKKRIEVANYLKATTAMTEAQIAEYVGYSSYSGYYKAKKFFED